MGCIRGFTRFMALIIVSIFIIIISSKRHVDLLDENSIKKLKEYNYKSFEIKRKRRPSSRYGSSFFYPSKECSLEAEIPIPWSIIPPEDIIEVYGIENNNKYLIYKIDWSKENVKKMIGIVDELNKNLPLTLPDNSIHRKS
jgi:hypothetical protein